MGQRRTKPHAEKGQPFAREWVEFHAECAVYGCTRKTLVSQIGQASTVENALRVWSHRDEKSRAGWTLRDGLFYCPEHAEHVVIDDPRKD